MTMIKTALTLATLIGLTATALADAHKEPLSKRPAMKKEMPAMAWPPKAPPEVAALAKQIGGSWRCDGKAVMDPTTPTKLSPVKMKMSNKLDLGKHWISGTLTGSGFNGMSFTTWDAGANKWYRVMVDSWGGSEIAWSTGLQGKKVVWEGEGRGMGMTGMKVRTTEVMNGPKSVTMTGEMSMDGKSWMKGWEATCKK